MRFLLPILSAAALSLYGSMARAVANHVVTLEDVQTMDQTELNQLYLHAEPGDMPDGESHGKAVFFAGSIFAEPATLFASLIWQGKIFDRDNGVLVNRVFGFPAIKAELSYGPSLLDGEESIIIDYASTSVLAHPVRDEIRYLGNGLYLGRAYARTLFGPVMVVNFALQFPE